MTTASSARGTSLSITMHELRRPLTILNSYGQLLSTGMLGPMPDTATVAIDGITASTEMMVRMVNALAELSRLEDPEDKLTIEPMGLSDLVAGATETVTMESKLRDCTVAQDVAPDVTFRGDRRRLMLALTNILGNAVKHAPNGSTVTIRGWEQDDKIHIAVRDQGPGFAPEEADRLFEKYYRSVAERHRKVPGSGFGLYIVKTVAERHGGSVRARSELGRGAEFEMIVPAGERR
jgi:signal transduction histidine kinase